MMEVPLLLLLAAVGASMSMIVSAARCNSPSFFAVEASILGGGLEAQGRLHKAELLGICWEWRGLIDGLRRLICYVLPA